MQALDRCGWPCTEKDLILLENEIRQADMYIQQAKDLQAAAKNRGSGLNDSDDDGGKNYDDAASVASSGSRKSFEGSDDFGIKNRRNVPLIDDDEEEDGDNDDEQRRLPDEMPQIDEERSESLALSARSNSSRHSDRSRSSSKLSARS